MPSLGAGREVDIEIVILKEVDPDYVPAGSGDVNDGFVDPGERRRIAEFIAIGKCDEHVFIVCDGISARGRRESHVVGWRENHVRRAAIEERWSARIGRGIRAVGCGNRNY